MNGDVVTAFDGQRVVRGNQFSRLVEETPPGWTVRMTIVRDGKTREVFYHAELIAAAPVPATALAAAVASGITNTIIGAGARPAAVASNERAVG